MTYDKENIFAKILRGEIPCKKIYEDDYVLSFHDINPQKKSMFWRFQKENTLTWMILLKRQVKMKLLDYLRE